MSRAKDLMPFAAILFGVALLILAEGALRLFWTPPALQSEQLAAVVIDPFEVVDGTARTRSDYLSAMRPVAFEVPKPTGVFRVFCIGGSTTLGFPYPSAVAWPASLQRRLQFLWPNRTFEVVNLGATSYGSARTLAVLRGIQKYQPDLVVVATGDAEFVEDSFRVAVESSPKGVGWLHGLYLSRAIKMILPAAAKTRPEVPADDQSMTGFLFSPAPSGTVYRVTEDRRRQVMTAFRDHLRQMTELAGQRQIPLVMATLPANVADWPPDPDPRRPADPEQREAWEQAWAEARRLAAAGAVDAALDRYATAAQSWRLNAQFCYDYGRLLLKAERFEQARRMLYLALDLDPVPVRATTEINQAVREVAGEGEALLADVAAEFRSLAPHGLPGDDLILDYAHPTPPGHAAIAATVRRTLTGLGVAWQPDERSVGDIAGAESRRAQEDVGASSADLSFALGQVFERKGLLDRAVDYYRQAIDQGYEGPFAAYRLAGLFSSQGRYADALQLLEPLVKRYPDWQEPYGLLGYLYQRRGQPELASVWYQRALQSGARDLGLYLTLAEIRMKSGRADLAAEVLRQGLDSYPEDCTLAARLGRSLELQQLPPAEVESYYRDRIADRADCQLLRENYGLWLMQQRRWAEAAEVFKEALRRPEPLPFHHLNLGLVYWQGFNDFGAAKEQFARFLELRPDQAQLIPARFRQELQGGAP